MSTCLHDATRVSAAFFTVLGPSSPLTTAPGACCRDGRLSACILIGEVVLCHASKGVLAADAKGRPAVDPERLAPISRLGHADYGLTTATIEMGMPHHKAPS